MTVESSNAAETTIYKKYLADDFPSTFFLLLDVQPCLKVPRMDKIWMGSILLVFLKFGRIQ
jgi:hypothetical protein